MNGPGTPRRRSPIRAAGRAGGAVIGISLLGIVLSATSSRPSVHTRSAATTVPAAELSPGTGFDLRLGDPYGVPSEGAAACTGRGASRPVVLRLRDRGLVRTGEPRHERESC